MADRPVPLNCVYDPTNPDLILLLNQKLQNKPIPFDQVIHLDLYSNHPSTLLHNTQPSIKRTQEHVIYTPRYPSERGSQINFLVSDFGVFCEIFGENAINRLVSGGKVGIWKRVSDFGYVVKIDGSDGNVIGREMRFVFYQGDVDDVGVLKKTDWYMTEFTTLNEDEGGFAICKVGEDAARAVDDFWSDDEYEEVSEEESEDDSDEE